MARQSITKYPGIGRSFAEGSFGNDAWSSPTNVYSRNAAYASITAATFDGTDLSQVLTIGHMGFTMGTAVAFGAGGTSGTEPGTAGIPMHGEPSVITGIGVTMVKYGTFGWVRDELLQLTMDGTTGTGSNFASSGSWGSSFGGSGGTYSYGGSDNLWGCRITPQNVAGTGFGVRFAARSIGTDSDAYIDVIFMTVYYDTLGEVHPEPSRISRRISKSPDKDTGDISKVWIQRTQGGTYGTASQVPPVLAAASGTHSTIFSAGTGTAGTAGSVGTFYFHGTAIMTIGSAGTVSGIDSTFGLGQEVYFCNTAGTSKYLPTGVVAFRHYWVNTRGSSATSFTFGTSPIGTGGTQVNLTGTTGTHMLWVRWQP